MDEALNNVLDYSVIAAYFAAMIGAGYWGLWRARSADDFLWSPGDGSAPRCTWER